MQFTSSFKTTLTAAIWVALTYADQLTAIPLGPPRPNLHGFGNAVQQQLEDGLELSLALPSGQQGYQALPTDSIPRQNFDPNANYLQRQYGQPTYGQGTASHFFGSDAPLATGSRDVSYAQAGSNLRQYSLDHASTFHPSGLQQAQVTMPHWLREPTSQGEQRRTPAALESTLVPHTAPQAPAPASPRVEHLVLPPNWQSMARREKQQWLVEQGKAVFGKSDLIYRKQVLDTNLHAKVATDKEKELIFEILKMKGYPVTMSWNDDGAPDGEFLANSFYKFQAKAATQPSVSGPFDMTQSDDQALSNLINDFKLGDYWIRFSRRLEQRGRPKVRLTPDEKLAVYVQAFRLPTEGQDDGDRLTRIYIGQLDIHSGEPFRIQSTSYRTKRKAAGREKAGQTSRPHA